MRSRSRDSAPPASVQVIDFNRTKYGLELLVDVAYVREMPAFLLEESHVLTFYDITLITGGSGRFILDGHEHCVTPGAVFFSSPGQARRWNVMGLEALCLFFPSLFLDEFFSDPGFLRRLPFFDRPGEQASTLLHAQAAAELEESLLRMHGEVRAHFSDSTHLLRARLYEILITLSRAYTVEHGSPGDSERHPLVAEFREMVRHDVRDRHHVTDYARALRVSPGHLSALCRRYTGRGAKSIIQDALNLEARRLLLYTSASAEEIAYELGFDDPSYFSRQFRRLTGSTPRAFRDRGSEART